MSVHALHSVSFMSCRCAIKCHCVRKFISDSNSDLLGFSRTGRFFSAARISGFESYVNLTVENVMNVSDRQLESLVSNFKVPVNSTAGGLMTSEDGRERIGSTARLPGFPSHGKPQAIRSL
jgi:hypothetical protein